MKTLFACECCGFLSTIKQAFTKFKGLLVCKECRQDYLAGDKKIKKWLNLAAKKDKKNV